ncbi:ankyrin repeat domain-containing protein 34B [Nematolebias whitei]|uniref:ankyrin repeat domain-containing protein 34B n=1 Tax=Nematolebias whitei TaxID=451745 RepID=UPI00189BA17B|nr:ankyrin repeat domain-containing protein 34B [Nematolebias whitei]
MQDPLTDCTPLVDAADSGKLRLVRLLVEGGAQVNGSNPRGETALLAACKALRGEPAGPEAVKLLRYLLQNKADPNAQDHTGRTPLMYACMERAGVQVAQTLVAAGADPCVEDCSGASALVYAVNAQHQPTVQVLLDACQARGRDIIIIATEMGTNVNPVTRRYLNVPRFPDSSPVSCMSPSEILLKTGSPNSTEGENIFNFRGTNKPKSGSSSRRSSCELSSLSPCGSPASRGRISSEPWLDIQNLASLNRVYEEGVRETRLKEDGGGQGLRRRGNKGELHHPVEQRDGRVVQRRENAQPVLSLMEKLRCSTPGGSASAEELSGCLSSHSQLRRNTLPSVTLVPPPLHLPSLTNPSDSRLQVPSHASPSKHRTMESQLHPSCSSLRPTSLPPLASSVTSLVAPLTCCNSDRSRRSLRRHSEQLEQIRGKHSDL